MSYLRNLQGQSDSTLHDFGAPTSQSTWDNNNNNSINNVNGFSNNSNTNNLNSPSIPNELLYNQNGSNFNSLNISTRATGGPSSNPLPNDSNTHQNTSVYPSSRNSNLSPTLNFASLYSNRARFNASKGFEVEDDLEFCPEIHDHYQNSHSSHSTTTSSSSVSSTFTHHKFNPYTSSTFSPQVSPVSTSVTTASPSGVKSHVETTPKSDYSTQRTVVTPRAKRVLEIVNPVTGLRVSSPAPYK